MPENKIAVQLINLHREQLNTALLYLHPFHEGGLLLIFPDEVSLVEAVSKETDIDIPDSFSLHRLRYSQLSTLCLPQIFYGDHILNERPHLLHWAKHRGQILYGDDIRTKLAEPSADQVQQLLVSHLKSCMLYVRGHLILDKLMNEEYEPLLQQLEFQLRQLTAISLLLKFGIWDISLTDVIKLFLKKWPSRHTTVDCTAFSRLVDRSFDGHGRDIAVEATWLFISFLKNLKDDVI